MEYNSYLQNCGDDDVISFGYEMYKVGKLKPALRSAIIGELADILVKSLKSKGIKRASIYDISSRGSAQKANWKWFHEGKTCEILRIGAKGWQKGKVRVKITVEFCSDPPEEIAQSNEPNISQPESPLDDIRQMMAKDN